MASWQLLRLVLSVLHIDHGAGWMLRQAPSAIAPNAPTANVRDDVSVSPPATLPRDEATTSILARMALAGPNAPTENVRNNVGVFPLATLSRDEATTSTLARTALAVPNAPTEYARNNVGVFPLATLSRDEATASTLPGTAVAVPNAPTANSRNNVSVLPPATLRRGQAAASTQARTASAGKSWQCSKVFLLQPGPANISFAIFSAANRSYWPKRYLARRLYVNCLRAAGFDARFFVGTPWASYHTLSSKWHMQGMKDMPDEQDDASALLAEADRHGDMVIAPMRDGYTELSSKLLFVLQTFCERSTEPYLVKQDDEYGVRVRWVQDIISEHEKKFSGQELYAGVDRFMGTEYQSFAGPDGTKAPFIGGRLVIMSRRLACLIVQEDAAHSALKSFYGTSSDDANLGKWVDYAARTHDVKVRQPVMPLIVDLKAVEKMAPAGSI